MTEKYFYGFISGLALGLTTVAFFKYFRSGGSNVKAGIRSAFKSTGDYKMVLVVRSDLNMGKGKIAAQCCHAALGCYQKANKTCPEFAMAWASRGQPKIVVKLDPKDNEDKLYELEKQAKDMGLPCCVVHDAGHTQVRRGTATCAGFGPAPVSLVDEITGSFKLL